MTKEYDWNGRKIEETDDWDRLTGHRTTVVGEVLGTAKTDDRTEQLERNVVATQGVLDQLYKYLQMAMADRQKAHQEFWHQLKDLNPELFAERAGDCWINHNTHEICRYLTDEERGEFSMWKWEQKEKERKAAEPPSPTPP